MGFLVNEGPFFLQNVILLLELSVLRGRIFKMLKTTIKPKVNSTLKKYVELEGDSCESIRFCVRRFLFLSLMSFPATFPGHVRVPGQCKYRTSTELLLSQLPRAFDYCEDGAWLL